MDFGFTLGQINEERSDMSLYVSLLGLMDFIAEVGWRQSSRHAFRITRRAVRHDVKLGGAKG
jgi:hypothetical protein